MTTARRVPRPRTIALGGIGLGLSIVALWLAARGVDLDRTAAIVARADLRLLALALVLLAIQVVARAIRWRMLLPGVGSKAVPISRIIPVLLVGYLGNTVLPARLGEGFRAVLLARREDLPIAGTAGSVVLERILDVLTLALVGLVAALITGVGGSIVGAAVIAIAVAAGAVTLLVVAPRLAAALRIERLKRVGRLIGRFLEGADVAGRPLTIGRAAGVTIGVWLVDAGIYWLAARAIGLELPFAAAAVISAAAVLSTALPAAPGYVGTFELAAAGAAGAVGVEPASALALALVAHALAVLPIALAGAVSLVMLVREPGSTVTSQATAVATPTPLPAPLDHAPGR